MSNINDSCIGNYITENLSFTLLDLILIVVEEQIAFIQIAGCVILGIQC